MDKIIKITRHLVKNTTLTPWVKFIWQIEVDEADFHFKLLPTGCIDIILNLASDMVYEVASEKIVAPPFHINGLRSRHSFIHQEKTVRIFGISFYPYGLFPFVHKSLLEIKNKVTNLFEFAPSMANKLSNVVVMKSTEEILSRIESVLLAELDADKNFIERTQILFDFITKGDQITVQSFCEKQSVNIKTFERVALQYTGFTPKALHNICRFQTVGNQLTHGEIDTLAGVAYDNSFTDQAHFVNAFRRFSGVAPGVFLSEKISVKENAIYTYQ